MRLKHFPEDIEKRMPSGKFMSGVFMFCFTDQLCHGTHGAVHAPTAWLKQNHGYDAKNCGSQHDTIKTKGKLCYSIVE